LPRAKRISKRPEGIERLLKRESDKLKSKDRRLLNKRESLSKEKQPTS
jgi:hypothetical protein